MYEFCGSPEGPVSSTLQVYKYHPKTMRYFKNRLLQHLLWRHTVHLWPDNEMRHTAPMVIRVKEKPAQSRYFSC